MNSFTGSEDYNNTSSTGFSVSPNRRLRPLADQDYDDGDENRTLPGFRFRPTDEELVGFYLRAKVDKKPMKVDHLILETDIYKHNPWDLPKTTDGGDNSELYFFCKRGRKYRNSERPNRVITGSGFWKATGIDKPIYTSSSSSSLGGVHDLIGLKKSLVYYRGSAGKGTKTDWMMHELRLPNANSSLLDKPATQEAEVWTVCRIFRRINTPNKTYTGEWVELPSKQSSVSLKQKNPTTVDLELDDDTRRESYISFASPTMVHHNNDDKRSILLLDHHASLNLQKEVHMNEGSGIFKDSSSVVVPHHQAPISAIASTSSSSNFNAPDLQMDQQQFISNYETWDELRYVVDHQFGFDSSHL